jgi:Tfp pilus assembly protein PilF
MGRWKQILVFSVLVVLVVYGCASEEEKKRSHFEKGKAYFEKGEYKSARIEFKNAIQIDPEFTEAYIQLAETNLKLGDARGAFQAYFRVAELDPEKGWPNWIRKIPIPS